MHTKADGLITQDPIIDKPCCIELISIKNGAHLDLEWGTSLSRIRWEMLFLSCGRGFTIFLIRHRAVESDSGKLCNRISSKPLMYSELKPHRYIVMRTHCYWPQWKHFVTFPLVSIIQLKRRNLEWTWVMFAIWIPVLASIKKLAFVFHTCDSFLLMFTFFCRCNHIQKKTLREKACLVLWQRSVAKEWVILRHCILQWLGPRC